jgi:hypothetical protein
MRSALLDCAAVRRLIDLREQHVLSMGKSECDEAISRLAMFYFARRLRRCELRRVKVQRLLYERWAAPKSAFPSVTGQSSNRPVG